MLKKLNKNNYHNFKNEMISNSKINDFLRSKEYYKAKHIDRTIKPETSSAMQFGSMVDEVLSTGSFTSLKRKYIPKFERTCFKKDDPDKYDEETIKVKEQEKIDKSRLVSNEDYDDVIKISKKIIKSDFYKWYKTHGTLFQQPLEAEYDGVKVCGMADAITVLDDVIYLDDFKTTQAGKFDNPKQWFWYCKKMGYLRQLAHYKEMIRQSFPRHQIICRHLVISSDLTKHDIKLFEFHDSCLFGQLEEFKKVAKQIVEEKDWVDEVPAQAESIIIFPPKHDYD